MQCYRPALVTASHFYTETLEKTASTSVSQVINLSFFLTTGLGFNPSDLAKMIQVGLASIVSIQCDHQCIAGYAWPYSSVTPIYILDCVTYNRDYDSLSHV